MLELLGFYENQLGGILLENYKETINKEEDIKNLKNEIKNLQAEIAEIKRNYKRDINSPEYKIGKILLKPARKAIKFKREIKS